ncbi:hypothetical protein CYLTODRAFT_183553 [Cylindrobasidium torrendii FP15055 ss-10]|uniref:Uncharacterized protein n=1 Tax=Cylindrobasidium torrendii FP15055 ss-10 TaxID=1314674 RepID=A0A0D7AVK2_9AGAR|nr:hypothetical protein CYLTODRAFT_183553 [Cylindrobasidium torrendii FP15055 ss-10]
MGVPLPPTPMSRTSTSPLRQRMTKISPPSSILLERLPVSSPTARRSSAASWMMRTWWTTTPVVAHPRQALPLLARTPRRFRLSMPRPPLPAAPNVAKSVNRHPPTKSARPVASPRRSPSRCSPRMVSASRRSARTLPMPTSSTTTRTLPSPVAAPFSSML